MLGWNVEVKFAPNQKLNRKEIEKEKEKGQKCKFHYFYCTGIPWGMGHFLGMEFQRSLPKGKK